MRKKTSLMLLILLCGMSFSCSSQGRQEYRRIDEKRADLKANRTQIKKGLAAPDFTLIEVGGTDLSLSDFKGKYVLLDFWASWCPTCKKHNKRLIPIYERLNAEGFEIIGLSLDRKEEAWRKAITKRGYPWKQVSDFKGVDSEVALAYGIQYVPNFILLDPDGKVVKKYHEDSIGNLEEDLKKLMGM